VKREGLCAIKSLKDPHSSFNPRLKKRKKERTSKKHRPEGVKEAGEDALSVSLQLRVELEIAKLFEVALFS
jgi:hypothetical protein